MDNIDLHNHTTYSDGSLTIREVMEIAKNKNLSFLAITDHFTTSWKQNIISPVTFENINQYCSEIRDERTRLRVKCLVGLEIDMESSLADIRRIPFNQFEILLFEYVDSIIILNKVISLIHEFKPSALLGLAHNSYIRITNLKNFCNILAENNIYFELNARYLNPNDGDLINRLKTLKEYGIRFTIGSDAHDKAQIGNTAIVSAILEKIDGFENVIDMKNINFHF
ncbi:MAG TPA: PHP domain-containing protein [Candidatus Deferrimicrobium sp.]|nr:PHP domain-containing protein [Candidatus Deferrimicrobium sp.]